MSEAEKSYLRKELVNLNVGHDLPSTPWKAILTSRSVVALLIGSFLADWTYYVVETDLPKYMNDVLHVSVEENGIYSSIPWAVFVPVALLSSYWCDWLISSGRLNITQTRKLFVFICEFFFSSFRCKIRISDFQSLIFHKIIKLPLSMAVS